MGMGTLISFAGIDGAGKTTQASMLVEWLRESGLDAVATKTALYATYSIFALAERLYGDPYAYHPRIPSSLREFAICCDVLRFSDTVLTRLVGAHDVVVWDRGPLCYEVYARCYDADMAWPLQLLSQVHQPDLTVVLDLDIRTAHGRLKERVEKPQRTNEGAPLLERVRTGYLRAAADKPGVVVVHASAEPAIVAEGVRRQVAQRLGGHLLRAAPRERLV